MNAQDEQSQAAEALAMVREHQEQTRRAARVPWWIYVAMFVLSAAGTAANDFVSINGSKLIAGVLVVVLVAVLVASFVSKSSLLSRARGVQGKQSFDPRVFGAAVMVAGAGIWLILRYGSGFAHAIAAAVGMGGLPYTVTGVFYGAVFTALFAVTQVMLATSQGRARR